MNNKIKKKKSKYNLSNNQHKNEICQNNMLLQPMTRTLCYPPCEVQNTKYIYQEFEMYNNSFNVNVTTINNKDFVFCRNNKKSKFKLNDKYFIFELDDGIMVIKIIVGYVITIDDINNVLIEKSSRRIVENFYINKQTNDYIIYECKDCIDFRIIVHKTKIEIENFLQFPGFKLSNKRYRDRYILEEYESSPRKLLKYPSKIAENVSENTPDILICSICKNKKINTFILDCEHSCMCSNCSKKIMETTKKCPICRKDIKSGIKNMFIG